MRAPRSRPRKSTRPAPRGAQSTQRPDGGNRKNDRRNRIPTPRSRSRQEPRGDRRPRGNLRPVGRRRSRLAQGPDSRRRVDANGQEGLGKTAAAPAAETRRRRSKCSRSRARISAGSIERLLVELRIELQGRLVIELTEMHETQMLDPRDDPGPGPQNRPKIADRAADHRRPVQERGRARRPQRALAGPGPGNRVRHRPANNPARPLPRNAHDRKLAEGRAKFRSGRYPGDPRRGRPPGTRPRRYAGCRPPRHPRRARPSLEVRERERELNRLIAELKMVRMIQARLNDDTVVVDKAAPPLAPPALTKNRDARGHSRRNPRSLVKIGERLPSRRKAVVRPARIAKIVGKRLPNPLEQVRPCSVEASR